MTTNAEEYNIFDDLVDLPIGKKIIKIEMSEDYLLIHFEGNDPLILGVEADCCSMSYFHDFIGAENVIGKKLISIDSVYLNGATTQFKPPNDDINNSVVKVYGYQIVATNDIYGELRAVFSFRNASNGYYGGELRLADRPLTDEETAKLINITSNFTF